VIAGGSGVALGDAAASLGPAKSFGLKDLADGLNHASLGSVSPVDPAAWSVAFAWARTDSTEECVEFPAADVNPTAADAFLTNPYYLPGIAGLCPSLLANVPVLACSASGSHNSTEETRRSVSLYS
jgi:hypothetical protein